jgi:hypothetical protein
VLPGARCTCCPTRLGAPRARHLRQRVANAHRALAHAVVTVREDGITRSACARRAPIRAARTRCAQVRRERPRERRPASGACRAKSLQEFVARLAEAYPARRDLGESHVLAALGLAAPLMPPRSASRGYATELASLVNDYRASATPRR